MYLHRSRHRLVLERSNAMPTSLIEDTDTVLTEAMEHMILSIEEEGQHVCSIDTETSSFRGSVIQIAFVAMDRSGNVIPSCTFASLLHLPREERIDPRARSVHGISEHDLWERGVPPAQAMSILAERVLSAKRAGARIVAHNSDFDSSRILHTSSLAGVDPPPLRKEDLFCTMRSSTLPRKRPRNAELYEYLHGSPPPSEWSLHDAETDAKITALNYLEGERRRWWGERLEWNRKE